MYDNTRGNDCSINGDPNRGPVFGNDLFISNKANSNTESYSNLGYNYKYSGYTSAYNQYTYNSYNNPSYNNDQYLAGSRTFQVEEIEVYAKI